MFSNTATTTVIFIVTFIIYTLPNDSMDTAIKYLMKYGFLEHSDGPIDYHSGQVHNALRSFQKFADLKVTGRLDEATKRKIEEELNDHSQFYDLHIEDENTMHKWDKRNLTYSIESLPKQLPLKVVRNVMRIAFDAWSAIAPLNFTEVPTNGDIKIEFGVVQLNDGSSIDGKGRVLAYALLPPHGLIHFDVAENWIFMKTNELSRYDTVDLLPTAIHEVGHVLGLEHSREKDSVMSPFYHPPVDDNGRYILPKLTGFDILRIQGLYGSKKTRKRFMKSDLRVRASKRIPPQYWLDLFRKRRERER